MVLLLRFRTTGPKIASSLYLLRMLPSHSVEADMHISMVLSRAEMSFDQVSHVYAIRLSASATIFAVPGKYLTL